MKKSIKKLISTALCAILALALVGCSQPAAPATDDTQDGGPGASAGAIHIGVIQFATHPSLDNCYAGFVQGLAENGFTEGDNLVIDFQNANSEMGNSDLQAKNMVTSGCDLIMGIATPAAMSAYAAAKESGIPVIFNAVSDPVASGIVKSLEAPDTNCTGSADVLDFPAQLELIRAFLPDAKTIGVIYTTSEANSISQLETLCVAAKDYGFAIESIGVSSSAEVAAAAASLVAVGVDCFDNLTDNNVVDNLSTVLHAANEAGIPVFGSEIEQVKNGCLASMSIDYIELGRVTGEMAAKILKGETKAGELPVSTQSETFACYNSAVASQLGIEVPAVCADAQDVAA